MSAPWTRTASTPVRCLAWRWKTTVTGTMRRPWSFTSSRPPASLRTLALVNLGLIYEDRGQFDRAVRCYQRVVDAFPNHQRAAPFLRDSQASGDMFFDEDALKKRDRVSQVLNLPVTDFELSVRSRNCLQKMGIMTIGDLCRTTEQELLSSKNFGETSLIEIREMLASKGLQLGQYATDARLPRASTRKRSAPTSRRCCCGRSPIWASRFAAEVHGSAGDHDDRRIAAAERRRAARVQELRRHELERGPR